MPLDPVRLDPEVQHDVTTGEADPPRARPPQERTIDLAVTRVAPLSHHLQAVEVGVPKTTTTTRAGTAAPPIAVAWGRKVEGVGTARGRTGPTVENKVRMAENDTRVDTAAPVANLAGQNAPVALQPPPAAAAAASMPDQAPHRNPDDPTDYPDLPDHRRVIAIDGAAAAGKTTVARALADRLKVTLFDTGALYRAVTLAAIRAGAPVDSASALADLASRHSIRIARRSVDDGRLYDVLLDDEDVTWAIRGADVDQYVSAVSAHAPVREALLPVQRGIADGAAVVMVGRDIGTVVTPTAGVKIFLAASLAERARRRHAELQDRGVDVDMDFIVQDLERRDAIDTDRAVSPLRAADDATLVETDGRSIEEVVSEIEGIVSAAWTPDAGNRA